MEESTHVLIQKSIFKKIKSRNFLNQVTTIRESIKENLCSKESCGDLDLVLWFSLWTLNCVQPFLISVTLGNLLNPSFHFLTTVQLCKSTNNNRTYLTGLYEEEMRYSGKALIPRSQKGWLTVTAWPWQWLPSISFIEFNVFEFINTFFWCKVNQFNCC